MAKPLGTYEQDDRFMLRALALAEQAYGLTAPNPLVGALVLRGSSILGEGIHRGAGARHAEVLALENAGTMASMGSPGERPLTLVVNLEPCIHEGRTPPCVDAILAAPVGRVVAGMIDPDPRVQGRGVEKLRSSGVEVVLGCREDEAAELNHLFVGRQRRGRPFVALKVALSADDCIAAGDGTPVDITEGAARRHTHRLRAGHEGLLIGVETVRRDRPRLDCRLYDGPGGRRPRRLVLDPELRSEPEWLWPGEEPPVLFCRPEALGQRGDRLGRCAELVSLPARGTGLDLDALPDALGRLGLSSVLVEGGGKTHRAFLEAGLWDRLYCYRNPTLRLAGLEWVAASVWAKASQGLRASHRCSWGRDTLEIFTHPAACLQTGTPGCSQAS